jgi:hypothetical protein
VSLSRKTSVSACHICLLKIQKFGTRCRTYSMDREYQEQRKLYTFSELASCRTVTFQTLYSAQEIDQKTARCSRRGNGTRRIPPPSLEDGGRQYRRNTASRSRSRPYAACFSRLWVLTRRKLRLRSARPSTSQRSRSRFLWHNKQACCRNVQR